MGGHVNDFAFVQNTRFDPAKQAVDDAADQVTEFNWPIFRWQYGKRWADWLRKP